MFTETRAAFEERSESVAEEEKTVVFADAVENIVQATRIVDKVSSQPYVDSNLYASREAVEALLLAKKMASAPSAESMVQEVAALAGPKGANSALQALALALGSADEAEDVKKQLAEIVRTMGAESGGEPGAESGDEPGDEPGVELSSTGEEVVQLLQKRLEDMDVKDNDTTIHWPPPPPRTSPEKPGFYTRFPMAKAVDDARRTSRLERGTSELPPVEELPQAMQLGELLSTLDAKVLGDVEVTVCGLVETVELVKPGDVFVMPWAEQDDNRETLEILDKAQRKGAVAVVFTTFDPKQGGSLAGIRAAAEGLQAVVAITEGSAQLAAAFHDPLPKSMQLIAVVGANSFEVRAAGWVLQHIMEDAHGDLSVAALRNGRSAVGRGLFDLGQLGACAMRELLSLAAAANIKVCVLEAAPGKQLEDTFEGLVPDLILDLGGDPEFKSRQGQADLDALQRLRTRVLEAARDDRILSAFHKRETREGAASPNSFEIIMPAMTDDLSSSSRWIAGGGRMYTEYFTSFVDMPASLMKRAAKENLGDDKLSELIDKVAHLPTHGPHSRLRTLGRLCSEASVLDDLEDPQRGVLRGRVLPPSSSPLLRIAFALPGCEKEREAELPIFGASAAKAVVSASCAALRLGVFSGLTTDGALDRLCAALSTLRPTPCTLEVHAAMPQRVGAPPHAVCLLQQAATVDEIRRTMDEVNGWMRMLNKGTWRRGNVSVVIGCKGEVSRGDRAKIGWCLAGSCDRLFLTSSDAGSEPPMQIIEDVLEAVKQEHVSAYDDNGSYRQKYSTKRGRLEEVQVIADRTDAIKIALTSSSEHNDTLDDEGNRRVNIVLIFNDGMRDYLEVAGVDGVPRTWVHDDRHIVAQTIDFVKDVQSGDKVFDAQSQVAGRLGISSIPWRQNGTSDAARRGPRGPQVMLQSLHWSYALDAKRSSDLSPERI